MTPRPPREERGSFDGVPTERLACGVLRSGCGRRGAERVVDVAQRDREPWVVRRESFGPALERVHRAGHEGVGILRRARHRLGGIAARGRLVSDARATDEGVQPLHVHVAELLRSAEELVHDDHRETPRAALLVPQAPVQQGLMRATHGCAVETNFPLQRAQQLGVGGDAAALAREDDELGDASVGVRGRLGLTPATSTPAEHASARCALLPHSFRSFVSSQKAETSLGGGQVSFVGTRLGSPSPAPRHSCATPRVLPHVTRAHREDAAAS